MIKYNCMIKYYIRYLFVISLLFFAGCNSYYITSDGGIRPQKKRFKLLKEANKVDYYNNIGNYLIDTNVVYINKSSVDSIDQFIYFRFFSNGRVLYGYPSTTRPNVTDVNNLNSGAIGYFKIENNHIYIEIFGLVFGDCQYITYCGIIKSDSIVLYKARLNRLSSYQLNETYIKSEYNLKGIATW